MPFIKENFDPNASGSSGIGRAIYSTSDTLATVEADGYFDAGWALLRGTKAILVLASDGEAEYRLTVAFKDVTLELMFPSADKLVMVEDYRLFPPEKLGAKGDGTANDQAALLAAAAVAVAQDKTLWLSAGRDYLFTQMTLPDGLRIGGPGRLRSDGSLTGSAVTLTLGANTIADLIDITTPGTETNTDVLFIGNGCKIGAISIAADVQRSGGGIITEGQDVYIGHLYTRNINRPIDARSSDTSTVRSHFYLESFDIEGYTRGIRIQNQAYFHVGDGIMRGRSSYASMSPGHNGVLLVGSRHGTFGDLQIEDSGEHAFRIGGSLSAANRTEQVRIASLKVRRSGGCAFKCNPTLDLGGGVVETADFITVGDVVGIDIGEGGSSNAELLRISHARSMYIDSAFAQEDAFNVSCQNALLMVDVNGLTIGTIAVDNVASRIINMSEDYDAPGAVGHVKNVRIDQLFARVRAPGTAYAIGFDFDSPSFEVGDIIIRNMDVTGYTSALALWGAQTLAGRILLEGRVGDADNAAISGAPEDARVALDVKAGGNHYQGQATGVRAGVRVIDGGVFDFSNVTTSGGLLVNARGSVAGLGNFGAAVALCRNGANRRGAALALKQTGSNAGNTGVAVFTGSGGSGATEAIVETFNFHHTGNFEVIGAGLGIILKQPNGTRKIVTVNDSGALVVANA